MPQPNPPGSQRTKGAQAKSALPFTAGQEKAESIWTSHEHQLFGTLPHLPRGLALPQKGLTSYGCAGINPIFFHSLIHLTNPYTQLCDIRVKSSCVSSSAFLFPTTFLFTQRKRLVCASLQALGQALTSQNWLDMSMLGPP